MIKEQVLAAELKNKAIFTTDNVSILYVSSDNRTLCLNVCSNKADRQDKHIPNSIILTEKPLENFEVIARIVSQQPYPNNLFTLAGSRVIANSLKDKLKSCVLLKEIRECI